MGVNAYLFVLLGFGLLFLCGNWLVKGGVQLSRHFKISPMVAGLTIVALGTSAPELFVSVKAVYTGLPDISIGNVVGSNIANVALILGGVAIVFPIRVRKSTLLVDWMVMMGAFVLMYLFLGFDGVLGSIEGGLFLAVIIVYITWTVRASRKQSSANKSQYIPPKSSLLVSMGYVLASIFGLYFGAEWLVRGASQLAIGWGVSERVVGISVVAIGTSIPEFATSLIASFKKQNDISIGNIIGSNIFNVFSILGITSLLRPLHVRSAQVISFDMVWMVGVSVLLVGLLFFPKRNMLSRWKGAVLLLTYILYIWLLFHS